MKIAFIGTHGVGKTGLAWSLAGYLKKEGFSVEMLPEAARMIADMGYKINENSTEKAQTMILKKQIQLENHYLRKYEILVCDRSVIDNFVYLLRVLKNMKLKKTHFEKKLKSYMNLIRNHFEKSPYDYIFYVPITNEKYSNDDHYRSKNEKFKQEIDKLLKEYLKTSRVLLSVNNKTRFIALPKKSQKNWNRIVKDTIRL
ncbi:ATP-binding protein [Candidatus Woesearchaeota archaeon]|nr:ATP-binding protein [Candidatus Woesearchaeota archaeon]